MDAQFQYQFNEIGRKIIPYVLAGVGGVMEQEGDFNIQNLQVWDFILDWHQMHM
ncbi:MAG: hypothetical protein IPO26_16555 [Saprospiraceae bacterium]|nr:hypothetical protein [Saprospiraceae bacterium]